MPAATRAAAPESRPISKPSPRIGVYGTSAITALTAQNTLGVTGVHAVPAEFVTAQIEAVVADIGCDAVKTGMLATAAIVEAVAAAVEALDLPNLVVDPGHGRQGRRSPAGRGRGARHARGRCFAWPAS